MGEEVAWSDPRDVFQYCTAA